APPRAGSVSFVCLVSLRLFWFSVFHAPPRRAPRQHPFPRPQFLLSLTSPHASNGTFPQPQAYLLPSSASRSEDLREKLLAGHPVRNSSSCEKSRRQRRCHPDVGARHR